MTDVLSVQKEAAELEKMLDENGVSLSVDHDLAGDIWENRPVLSCEPVTELDIKWAGESRADKCARIRKSNGEEGCRFICTDFSG